jgi:hypothetical protein
MEHQKIHLVAIRASIFIAVFIGIFLLISALFADMSAFGISYARNIALDWHIDCSRGGIEDLLKASGMCFGFAALASVWLKWIAPLFDRQDP